MDQNSISQQDSSPANSQMGAFEAGDIVLPPSEPVKNNSKPKIWLLVLVGVLVLAGAGFLIYNTVTKTNDEGNNLQNIEKASDAEIKQRFNVYANYLLYGKDEVNEDPKVISHLENYDVFNPQGIFAETADKDTLEKIEVRFREFLNIYDKYYFTALSLEEYFYNYLFSDKAATYMDMIEMRMDAINALRTIYADIYNIDLDTVDEVINE